MRTILQINLDGEVIGKYNSLTEASQATGITIAGISYVVNGHRQTAGHYRWKYLHPAKPFIKKVTSVSPTDHYSRGRKVASLDENGNLCTYNSIDEAAKQLKTTKKMIEYAIQGTLKVVRGKKWYWADSIM